MFAREKMTLTSVKILLLCFSFISICVVFCVRSALEDRRRPEGIQTGEKYQIPKPASRAESREIEIPKSPEMQIQNPQIPKPPVSEGNGEIEMPQIVLSRHEESEFVKLDVYYESLNAASLVFVKNQLKNVVYGLKNRVRVEFVPFGKSDFKTRGESTAFYCHMGPKECQGNKYHACILNRTEDQTHQMNMVLCMLEKGFVHSMETAAELCCHEFKMGFLDIRRCAEGEKATQLLKQHAERTSSVDVTEMPTVAVEGVFGTDAFQERVVNRLSEVVCEFLEFKLKDALDVDEFCEKHSDPGTAFSMGISE